MDDAELAELDFCYVTTAGRKSGRPHTIEIWFALDRGVVYMLSGGTDRADWVRNIQVNPTVGLRVGDREMIAQAHIVEDPDEDALTRRLLFEKYAPRYKDDLEEWARTALPIAIELPD